jgi:hypothetical protein
MTTVTQPANAPAPPWTTWGAANLALLPDDGRRYQILVVEALSHGRQIPLAARLCPQGATALPQDGTGRQA